MFYSLSDNYDVLSSSFLGDAIINDLVNKLIRSSEKLMKYSKTVKHIVDEKNNKILKFENSGPIKKIFLALKEVFSSKEPFSISLTEEERNMLDSYLNDYCSDNNELLSYNLEDNILNALVKEISGEFEFEGKKIPHKYSAGIVPGVLEESVIPDLKKLGLEKIIPKLQEKLIEEYKKDLPNSDLYNDKNSYYVPDFSNKTEINPNDDNDFNDSIEENDSFDER